MRKNAAFLFVLLFCGSIVLAGADGNRKKFELEWDGGFSLINPEDLNLRTGFQEAYEKYWNEDFLAYALDKGYIESLDVQKLGEYKKLRRAIPLGLRLKYSLSASLAISLGLKVVSGSSFSETFHQYICGLQGGGSITRNYSYFPLNVSAWGIAPMMGAHFSLFLNPRLQLAAYVSGGPLFGFCRQIMGKSSLESSNINPGQESYYKLEYKGSGLGMALDTGIQVRYPLRSRINVFFEGGYSFQRIKKISGTGKTDTGTSVDTWEGDWGIIRYQNSGLWGTMDETYFTNSWDGREDEWIRGFVLDLSGFQVKAGLGFYF
ncbi:MAG: hypothetical protein JXB26_11830 [Candidatus Aminicenantes bacterium]|nr:hypothetical protein [Candidatus Aminicenantes bacterium]